MSKLILFDSEPIFKRQHKNICPSCYIVFVVCICNICIDIYRPSSGAFIHFYNVQRDVVDLQRVVVRGLLNGNPDFFLIESGLFSLFFTFFFQISSKSVF